MSYFKCQLKGQKPVFKLQNNGKTDAASVSAMVQKTFGIKETLTCTLYGSRLENNQKITSITSQEDILVFSVDGNPVKLPYDLRKRDVPIKTNFIVYSNLTVESMLNGNEMIIDTNSTPEDVSKQILKELRIKINDPMVIVYLPGGLLFQNGTLNDFFSLNVDSWRYLHAVIIKKPPTKIDLLGDVKEICNIKDPLYKYALSPIIDVSEQGLKKMAIFLGYLQHNGEGIKDIYGAVRNFTPFAPLITGLMPFMRGTTIAFHQLLSVVTGLTTFFAYTLDQKEVDALVYDTCFEIASYIVSLRTNSTNSVTMFSAPFASAGYEEYLSKYTTGQDTIFMVDSEFRHTIQPLFLLPKRNPQEFGRIRNDIKYFVPVRALDILQRNNACIVDKDNELILVIGKREATSDQYDVIYPTVGSISIESPVTLLRNVVSNGGISRVNTTNLSMSGNIDPASVTQLIVFLVDQSWSMEDDFFQDFNRLETAKLYFNAFVDNSYAFRHPSRYSLYSFGSRTKKILPFSDLSEQFTIACQTIQLSGCTQLYQCYRDAIKDLINERGNYPNAQLRIVSLTDGGDDDCDDGVNITYEILKQCINNKILIDTFILGDYLEKSNIGLAFATGGCAINDTDPIKVLQICENEALYNIKQRDYTIPNKLLSKGEYEDFCNDCLNRMNQGLKLKPLPTEITSNKAVPTRNALTIAVENWRNPSGASPDAVRAISRQLRIIFQMNKNDKSVNVFPMKDNVFNWRVVIQTPPKSWYKGYWYLLSLIFPPNYPYQPPKVTFYKPPFHMSINDTGYICANFLDTSYNSSVQIYDLLHDIIDLFNQPMQGHPADMTRQNLRDDPDEFQDKINQYNSSNGKPRMEDWLSIFSTDKLDENNGIAIPEVLVVPRQYLCPLSRRIMLNPVKSSTGVYYERDVLKRYVQSNPRPICAKTGNKLSPSDANLKVDDNFKKEINDWIEDNNYVDY